MKVVLSLSKSVSTLPYILLFHERLPLHVACRIGESPEVINKLLKAYPDSIMERTMKGSTPLMCAHKHEGAAVGNDDKLASECVVKMLEQAMKAKGMHVTGSGGATAFASDQAR